MKRLFHRIQSILKKSHPFGRLWRWAKKNPGKRFHALSLYTRQHYLWNLTRHNKDRAKFWLAKHTIYRRKWRKVRRHHHHHPDGPVGFETWMLNGHSGNISDGTKAVVAYAVVACGATVTDTYDYCCHAASSYHYPRNNGDGKGHAVDLVPATCTLMTSIRDHFGAGAFMELFGPCNFYYKFGQQYPGMFPGHGTHTHAAPSQ